MGPAIKSSAPFIRMILNLVDDDHFGLRHFLDGVFRAFLAHAALLQAAIRHQVGAPLGAPIDVQVTRVAVAHELHRSVDVVGEDGGTEAVIGIVG